MTAPENICPRCGSTVRGLSGGELCPACLLAACLDTAEDSDAPGEEIDEDWIERHGLEEAEAASGAGRRFGDYELFEEIGRGAMGFVRRARQVSLNRVVAIKFLGAGPLARPEAVRRFQAAAAAAALSHPGIVVIHEVGRRRHQHYLVMDYVSGTSLAKVVADGPLAAGRAARYVEAIAEAIHFAHEHGVLHRDLKPSNVLIDEEDRPRVTDFGLAKRLGVETGLTLSGQVMGSPGYLPPEQATGETGKIGRPSDVYSLGAMLYHLLVGSPPFIGENPAEIIRQVVEREPTSPRLLLPSVPRDLETICLRCLEKEPARRYPTARALADELGRYLRGEAIQARPLGIIGRTVRWCRRKPAQAVLTGSLGVAVALGLVSMLWGWSSTRQSFHREVEARQTTERALRQLEVQTARNFFANDQASAGVALLAAMVRREPTDRALAEWLMAELTGRNWPLPAVRPLEHGEPLHHAEFSADGRRILTAALDNTVRLWDAETGLPMGMPLAHDRAAIQHPELFSRGQKCLQACFSPDGAKVATASVDGTARVWDGRTGEPLTPPLRHEDWVTAVGFNREGSLIATGSRDGRVRRWNVANGQPSGIGLELGAWINFVEFSADGQWLVTGANDGGARVWSVKPPEVRLRVRHVGAVFDAGFSANDQRLLTASSDRTAVLWDVRTGRPLLVLRHPDQVRSAEFGVGESLILTTCADEQVRVWDGHDGRLRVGWRPHAGGLTVAHFSPDGARVATGSRDFTVRVWDARTGHSLTDPLRHRGVIRSVKFSPDGARLLTASQDGTARIWMAETGQPASAPLEHAAGVRAASFSANGQRAVTASEDRTARIWDVATGQPIGSPLRHNGRVFDAAFSPDGRWLATASLRSIWIWPVPDGGDGVTLWLPDLAEAVGGLRQVKETTTESVAATAWFEVVGRLRGWDDTDPGAAWRRWFLADRSTRPSCPGIGPRFQEDGEVGWSEAADAIAGMVNPRAERWLPARDPALPPRLIDLSDYYNASLEEDWRASQFLSHNLSTVPRGRQVFDGIEYDVRGVIQLASELLELRGLAFSRRLTGIPVHQACRRLHFLHAADCFAESESTIAVFTVHRSDGSQDRIPIRYGIEALPWDWESGGGERQAKVAWSGMSPAGLPVRLYRTTWTNACPEVKVETIDLESTGMRGVPFVVAITAEQ
ncbi:MAG: protein kinase [Verrucomicrobia bacterium]|nr:protein kinase [Verrucomicrobiota bacterium]